MAKKADYLKRSVYRAAFISAIAASVLTVALAFTMAALLGRTEQDALVAKNARDIAAIVQQARLTACINHRTTVRMLVDLPGPPYVAAVQNCKALPDIKYRFHRQPKGTG